MVGEEGLGAFGNVKATGNGTVVLVDTVVEGEIKTEDNRQVAVQ